MRSPLLLVPILFAVCTPTAGVAVVIDHQSVADLGAVPQGVMDFVGLQKWFFTHASVGSNMLSGMGELHAANSARYKLDSASVGVGASAANAPPVPTIPGRIYECPRGNPGWNTKYTYFDNSVRGSGWRASAIDFALDKLCYIDQTANAGTYITTLSALEATYPTTVFVYATMPLTTDTNSDNVLRNQYNQAVRTYCAANNKFLFDIADIEAHDPSGVRQTFTSGAETYDRLYSGYTTDGGHLDTAAGRQQIAKGWYAACAYGTRFVSYGETWTGGAAGQAGNWGAVGNWSPDSRAAIVPDAPGIKLTFGAAGANATADLGKAGRTVGQLEFLAAVPTALTGATAASLTLDNNGATSPLSVAGPHSINVSLLFKDNLEIGGGGTLDFNGSLTGAAGKILAVQSGTTVHLHGAAQDIGNSMTVNGHLESGWICVDTLSIGPGGSVTIRETAGAASSQSLEATAVPEPSTFVLLGIGAIGLLAYAWRRKA
jgi:hypothetical protein